MRLLVVLFSAPGCPTLHLKSIVYGVVWQYKAHHHQTDSKLSKRDQAKTFVQPAQSTTTMSGIINKYFSYSFSLK